MPSGSAAVPGSLICPPSDSTPEETLPTEPTQCSRGPPDQEASHVEQEGPTRVALQQALGGSCFRTETLPEAQEEPQQPGAGAAASSTGIASDAAPGVTCIIASLPTAEPASREAAMAAAALLVREAIRKTQNAWHSGHGTKPQHGEGPCVPALSLETGRPPPHPQQHQTPPPQQQQVQQQQNQQQQQKPQRTESMVKRPARTRGVRFLDRRSRDTNTDIDPQRESTASITQGEADLAPPLRRGSSRQRFIDAAKRFSSIGLLNAARLHSRFRGTANEKETPSSSSDSEEGSVCDIYESDMRRRLTERSFGAPSAASAEPQEALSPQPPSTLRRQSAALDRFTSTTDSGKGSRNISSSAITPEESWAARHDTRRISVAESLVICGRELLQSVPR